MKYIKFLNCKYLAVIIILLVTLNGMTAFADVRKNSYLQFGITPSLDFNSYSSDMRQLKDVADSVPRFIKGNSIGVSFGLFYNLPITEQISLFFRAGINYSNPEISGKLPYSVKINGNDTITDTEVKAKANLSSIYFEPNIKYYFYKDYYISGGFTIGSGINKSFTEEQKVLIDGSTFSDGNKTRQLIQKKEYDNYISTSINAAIGYEFGNFKKFPFDVGVELSFRTGYYNILKDFRLDYNTLKLGVNLKYEINNLFDTKVDTKVANVEMPKTQILKEPEQDKSYKLSISNKAIDNKIPRSFSQINLQEKNTVNIPPLLNYVFFNENDYHIPDRYTKISKDEAKRFTLKRLLNSNSLEAYHSILNIIGKRMQDNPNAHLKLVGCNSGKNEEKDNIELSNKRVRSVNDYLVNVWDIDSMRIDLENRSLPEHPSSSTDSMSSIENQRVEIQSNDLEILSPVIASDTLFSVDPAIIRFSVENENKTAVKESKFSIFSAQNPIRSFTVNDSIPNEIDWYLFDNILELLNSKGEIYTLLECKTKKDSLIRISSKPIKLNLTKKLLSNAAENGTVKIEKYGLVLFDFNKSELTEFHKKVIEFIASRIGENSSVIINGYTDLVGDENYNLELSKQRAFAVQKELSRLIKNYIEYHGFGENNMFKSDLPEARFYGRTVEIIVKTPLK